MLLLFAGIDRRREGKTRREKKKKEKTRKRKKDEKNSADDMKQTELPRRTTRVHR